MNDKRRGFREESRIISAGRELFRCTERIAGLFSRRGYNIDSLTVGETQNPAFSRMIDCEQR